MCMKNINTNLPVTLDEELEGLLDEEHWALDRPEPPNPELLDPDEELQPASLLEDLLSFALSRGDMGLSPGRDENKENQISKRMCEELLGLCRAPLKEH